MSMLGKYEVLEPLGTGSMGTVYRARDTVLERLVALKTIRTGAEVEPELRERFYREARACARLQHPNIVAVYDLGEADRTAYIAMELLLGSDFRKIIEQRRGMPLPARLGVMAEVCDALSHAHASGIIHRDVKPGNLFLLDNGHAKVLDFGIAKLPSSRLTVAGRILGTPNYMAPEQILCKPSDGRADLFSAAVVFFELLVYAHPFRSSLIPRRIVEDDPDSLFDYDSHLPPPLERAFARALSKDPERRYRTCEEFAVDLRAIADGLRQDSSPTLSRLELPSERAPILAAVPPRPAGPSCEEDDDWRLSEVLRLVRQFDEAMEARDGAAARPIFGALQAIEATDSRFTQAVQGCWARLTELAPETTPVPRPPLAPSPAAPAAAPATTEPPTHPKECGYCGTSNRSAAVFCIRCGAPFSVPKPAESRSSPPAPAPVVVTPPQIDIDETLTSTPAVSPSATVTPPVEPSLVSVAPAAAPVPTPVPPAAVTQPARPQQAEPRPNPSPAALAATDRPRRNWMQRHSGIALVASGTICVIVILLAVVMLRPVAVQPHVATAAISTTTAQVYEAPEERGPVIASPVLDDRLHVLELPHSRTQRWVHVQSVTSKVTRPGFLRLDQLTRWWSERPDVALTLVRVFGAGESGSDEQIEQQIVQFESVAERFPDHPERRDALLEVGCREVVLVKRRKDAGRPAGEWQPQVQTAIEHLRERTSDAALAGRASARLAEAQKMLAVPPPPPPPPASLSPKEITRLLKQAEERRERLDRADLAEAKRLVGRVLQADPNNAEAKLLLQKINRTEDLVREDR